MVKDWNVVATVRDELYPEAKQALRELAPVARTDYFNVLVLKVPDAREFAESLAVFWESNPGLKELFGRVTPLDRTFDFQTAAELEESIWKVAEPWLETLAGTRFHVRMHRRGFKGRLSSQEEEQLLDRWIRDALAGTGQQAEVTFDDPDFILDLETVGQRAGMSLWSRADLARYPFLHLD